MIGEDGSARVQAAGTTLLSWVPSVLSRIHCFTSDTRANTAGGTQYFVGNRNLLEDVDVEFPGASDSFTMLVTPISVYLETNCRAQWFEIFGKVIDSS